MYSIGCDQHKRYSFVVPKDEDGNTINQIKLYHTDKEALKAYFSSFPQNSVALETCGFDHWLGDLLEEIGLTVKLAGTAKTKAIAEERIKTDKLSANVLADLLRGNVLPEAYRPPRRVRDARQLMPYRLRLVSLRNSMVITPTPGRVFNNWAWGSDLSFGLRGLHPVDSLCQVMN